MAPQPENTLNLNVAGELMNSSYQELQMDPMLFGPSDLLNGSMGFIVYSLGHHIVRLLGGPINGMALSCFMWFVRQVD